MFTSLADLEQEFKKHQNAPLWTLFLGYGKNTRDRADNNEDVEDMDESWELLRDSISRRSQAGGKFTVFQKISNQTNAGFTHKIDIKVNNPYQTPGIGGIGMPGIGFMDVISDKLKIQELERDIKDLEAENEELRNGGIPGWANNLLNGPHGEKVLEICAPLIQTAGVNGINALVSVFSKNKVSGAPQPMQAQRAPVDTGDESEFDDRILPPLRTIANHGDVYQLLASFAYVLENDPEAVNELFSNLTSQ